MKRLLCLILAALMLTGAMTVSAEPYQSYTYNAYDEAVYSPDMYTVMRTLNGNDLGTGVFNTPTDLIYGEDGCVYLTDCKNNRIIQMNGQFKTLRVYSEFLWNGETLTLNSPGNVFVTKNGTMYIADNGNKRILICDPSAVCSAVLTKPESELFPQDKEFLPMDIVVTSTGVLYVLCDGIYQGAVVFDENNKFAGFFGSNTVEPTLQVIAEYFWKKIATKEQRSKMARYVPVQYSSMAIDAEDFVYTTVASTKDPTARIRKLNPLGNNILTGTDNKTLNFGDPTDYIYEGETYSSMLESVSVCGSSMFAALDRTGCKIFLYSQDGDLLSVFGGSGNYDGCFIDPMAVCFVGTDLAVLDGKKGEITIFSITEYGEALLQALEVYMDGRYDESLDLWKNVLKYSAGSYLANLGYGKALYQLGDYEEAMDYFELANEKQRYSDAYKKCRNRNLRDNFQWYVICLAGIIILWVIAARLHLFKKLFTRIGKVFHRKGADAQ